ncbi:hypothetical protein GQR58_019222 [Nymphon striatum]|nr:hypothetical protein GQR58_019222 [Nymphon striatum]
MRLPAEAGDYILRWYNNSDRRIITERPIKIIEQQITITSQDEAIAGTEVEISWDAPKGLKAYINIQLADEKPNDNARPFLYIKKKTSDYMRVPAIAAPYYPDKTINAAEKATAGTELDLSWKAPKGLDSFINIQLADEKPSPNAKHYIYTKKKKSEYLRLPSEAGNYILRWYTRKGYQILAEKPITIEAAIIEITAVDEAQAGSEIELFWKAPKGMDSFINIQLADEKPKYNAHPYIYTNKKTSGYMKVPEKTGSYMLRWYNKKDQKISLDIAKWSSVRERKPSLVDSAYKCGKLDGTEHYADKQTTRTSQSLCIVDAIDFRSIGSLLKLTDTSHSDSTIITTRRILWCKFNGAYRIQVSRLEFAWWKKHRSPSTAKNKTLEQTLADAMAALYVTDSNKLKKYALNRAQAMHLRDEAAHKTKKEPDWENIGKLLTISYQELKNATEKEMKRDHPDSLIIMSLFSTLLLMIERERSPTSKEQLSKKNNETVYRIHQSTGKTIYTNPKCLRLCGSTTHHL